MLIFIIKSCRVPGYFRSYREEFENILHVKGNESEKGGVYLLKFRLKLTSSDDK